MMNNLTEKERKFLERHKIFEKWSMITSIGIGVSCLMELIWMFTQYHWLLYVLGNLGLLGLFPSFLILLVVYMVYDWRKTSLDATLRRREYDRRWDEQMRRVDAAFNERKIIIKKQLSKTSKNPCHFDDELFKL